ncbi:Endoribonuclease L-PSP/chorismate mutase-like protein [Penicillium mononematosum]|uniref:Endoribonuclease L-PSP/chorismate mutase-like protein n=1 Tax=Penicillium mononematosum TaxID=268346 RepID=UPI002546A696|nr:Endoribonuclease L-PSP/chorismate mutase-like protein [Penicillium mononematosum]KAJ6186509.1 Endoribonuclease L-PSP/chorismate mutase-like protein [Penicillium mononematosum]
MGDSKLVAHGFRFVNWPGGEEAAESFGISHAVVVPPNIRAITVGGQLGIRADGTIPDKLEDEIDEAFHSVEMSLKAAGLGEDAWEYVYEIQSFEVAKDGKAVGDTVVATARKYLKNTKPVWTGVEAKALVFPGLHLEITVKAFLPN